MLGLLAPGLLPGTAWGQSGARDGREAPLDGLGRPGSAGALDATATLHAAGAAGRTVADRASLTDELKAAAIEQESAARRAASDGKSAPVQRRRLQTRSGWTREPASSADRRTALVVDPPEGCHPLDPGEEDRERPRAGPLRRRPRSTRTPTSTPASACDYGRPAQHGAAAALQHEHAHLPDARTGGDAARDVPRAAGHPAGRPAPDRHERNGSGERASAAGKARRWWSRPSTSSTSPRPGGAPRGARPVQPATCVERFTRDLGARIDRRLHVHASTGRTLSFTRPWTAVGADDHRSGIATA